MSDLQREWESASQIALDDAVAGAQTRTLLSEWEAAQPIGGMSRPPGAEAIRQLGLTARAGITGITALPNMVADAAPVLYNFATGANVPTFSGATRGLLDRAGLPAPQGRTERVVQDITSGMAGVGGTVGAANALSRSATPAVANALRFFSASPEGQAAGAVTGALASGYAREGGAPPWAQLGLGLVGATMGGGIAPALLGGTGRAVSSTVAPIASQAARERLVGGVLRDFSTDPTRVMARLGNVPEYVPGSAPTTAQAARDYGLSGLQTVVRGMDERAQIGTRLADNDAARTALYDRAAGGRAQNPYLRERIAGDRDRMADQSLDRAFANSAPVPGAAAAITAEIDRLLATPRGAGKNARDALNAAKADLAALQANGDDPRFLYDAFRKTLANIRDNKLDTTKPLDANTKALVGDVIRTTDSIIESGAPGYRQYLHQYAKQSRPLDRLEFLQVLRDLTTSKVSSGPNEREVFNAGFAGTVRTEAFRKAAQEAGITPAQQQIVRKIAIDIDRGSFEAGKNARMPGSDTMKNMTLANLVGQVLGKGVNEVDLPGWAKPLGVLYRIPEQHVRDILVDAMLNPAVARDLMVRAGPRSAETLAAEVARRSAAAGLGGAIGEASQ
jgi:hypothetical protein